MKIEKYLYQFQARLYFKDKIANTKFKMMKMKAKYQLTLLTNLDNYLKVFPKEEFNHQDLFNKEFKL